MITIIFTFAFRNKLAFISWSKSIRLHYGGMWFGLMMGWWGQFLTPWRKFILTNRNFDLILTRIFPCNKSSLFPSSLFLLFLLQRVVVVVVVVKRNASKRINQVEKVYLSCKMSIDASMMYRIIEQIGMCVNTRGNWRICFFL